MVITDEQRRELQAFCDERHLDCKIGVRHYRDGGRQVVIYPVDAHPCLALRIGTSYLEAKRQLEARFGGLTVA